MSNHSSVKRKTDGSESGAQSGVGQKKALAAQLRLTKDISDLSLPRSFKIVFTDPDDLFNFKIVMCPDEGFYTGGEFVFSVKVGSNYPHDAPKVKCETPVFHPNIDLQGNISLNIFREDWKPVSINSIVYGLQFLFREPNPDDPLNKEAADVLQTNRRLFEQCIIVCLEGGYIRETYYPGCQKL